MSSDHQPGVAEEATESVLEEGEDVSGDPSPWPRQAPGRKSGERARADSTRDPLTGLLHRKAFEEALRDLVGRTERDSRHALLVLDIDDFRVVNDVWGHAAGDTVLRRIGALFDDLVGDEALIGRIGDDEFAVLLRDHRVEEADARAQQLRDAVSEIRFSWEKRVFRCEMSVGLVPVDGRGDASDLLTAGSNASYVAKHGSPEGLHRYRADDTLIGLHLGELRAVNEVSEALDDGRLRLHYQEVYPLGSEIGDASFCEVLVRMLGRDGEIVAARDFVPVAEKYDLIPYIDRWVVKTALASLEEATAAAAAPPLFSVNVSGNSIAEPSFLDFVLDRVRERRFEPSLLCFEITETAAVSNLDATHRFMNALERQGCRFALDDFGSGVSSFRYLRELPVDVLKIHGSLVRPITEDETARAIVEAVVQVARSMELETVAEWVEREETLEVLRDIGVDHVQGHLFDAPKPLVHD